MENAVLLKAIIDNAIDGLITIDERGIVESINPAACKLFDYASEEVIGHNISKLMPQPDRSYHDRYLFDYRKTGKANIIGIGRELIGMKKNGSFFPFRLGVSEVKYSGRVIYAGFIHDLTREKEAEGKLQDYAAQLEVQVEERTHSLRTSVSDLQKTQIELNQSLSKEKELGQLKSRFVSIASHEFRTPLSLVQLSASLIERYAESLDQKNIGKHVVKIKDAVLNITAILNDFLSLEKLDSGMVKPSLSHFNLAEMAEEITGEMQVVLRGKQQIVFKHRGTIQKITLDQNLLKNCIIILIDNAIKYSGEESEIQFYTKINEHNCTIRVCDNGIGIPESDHKHLFEAFFRAHNTGNISGNGLGLSILSRYTGLMNGHVSFKSRVNRGTLFTLTFPKKSNHE
ncbi:PAS domain-containing sensor histidine kinase [Pedobacter sp. MC2016-05]|uniref:PAS domain-containing sensor histidine kinase n=1 Tax=Pedobacter sp. MC2016-05 TaxID=2994474 RepID=UPI002246CC04|nr:PAS domain-containing sensor histidine kinase [Pedobacter sp. MC2016-05]MCX2477279.1 PAS domain-containing sensor histidine kinase [Pedobacter sp. MC2016-05]